MKDAGWRWRVDIFRTIVAVLKKHCCGLFAICYSVRVATKAVSTPQQVMGADRTLQTNRVA